MLAYVVWSQQFSNAGVPLSKVTGPGSTVETYASSQGELLCQIWTLEVKRCRRMGRTISPKIGIAEKRYEQIRGPIAAPRLAFQCHSRSSKVTGLHSSGTYDLCNHRSIS